MDGGSVDLVWNINRPTAMDGGSVDFVWNINRPSHCLHGRRYSGFAWNEILPVHKKEPLGLLDWMWQ
jgi:hypothetical protein